MELLQDGNQRTGDHGLKVSLVGQQIYWTYGLGQGPRGSIGHMILPATLSLPGTVDNQGDTAATAP